MLPPFGVRWVLEMMLNRDPERAQEYLICSNKDVFAWVCRDPTLLHPLIVRFYAARGARLWRSNAVWVRRVCCGGYFEMVWAKFESLPESVELCGLVLNRRVNRYWRCVLTCVAQEASQRRSVPVRSRQRAPRGRSRSGRRRVPTCGKARSKSLHSDFSASARFSCDSRRRRGPALVAVQDAPRNIRTLNPRAALG
jgi:hypothetical protein